MIKCSHLPAMMAKKEPKTKAGSKLCFGKVNMETPMYVKMKFSAIKLRRAKNCLVMDRDSPDMLLKV